MQKMGKNGELVFEIWAPGGGAHVYACFGFYNPLGRQARVQVGQHTLGDDVYQVAWESDKNRQVGVFVRRIGGAHEL